MSAPTFDRAQSHEQGSGRAPYRVFVVEDDDWIRESVEHALGWSGSGLVHVGSAATAKSALRQIENGLEADVCLMDLGLPDMPGTAVIRELRKRRSSCTSIAFTIFDDAPNIVQAIRAGAQGYLLKSSPLEVVLAGIRDVASGGAPMSPKIARFVIDTLREGGTSSEADTTSLESLTRRERDVLSMLARGLTYAEAGHALNLRLGTVQGYVKRIYEKLQVESKVEAAALAQRVGLL